jgi:hypothetical protein
LARPKHPRVATRRVRREGAKATEQIPLLLGQAVSNSVVDKFKTISFNEAETIRSNKARRKPLKPTRPPAKEVMKFVEDFIAEKEASGEQPTLREAEERGFQINIRRSQVREAYSELKGAEVRRGRPRISPK